MFPSPPTKGSDKNWAGKCSLGQKTFKKESKEGGKELAAMPGQKSSLSVYHKLQEVKVNIHLPRKLFFSQCVPKKEVEERKKVTGYESKASHKPFIVLHILDSADWFSSVSFNLISRYRNFYRTKSNCIFKKRIINRISPVFILDFRVF